jgi:type I restriction enzyme S subunit
MTALVTKQLPLVAGAPDGFKNLRALILELAVRGKLVHQDPEEQPVSDLLAQISTALDKSRIKNKARKSTAVEQGLEPFFEAPVGWVWVRLGDLLSKIGAGSTPLGGKQAYLSSGVKFLRSQNVWNDGLRLDDVAHISIDTHQRMSGTHVAAGDILFNITGASIGRCAVVPCWFDTGNVSQHVTIIRPCVPDIGSYLHKVLMSRLVQDTVMAVQVGVSREGLSIGKLAQFPIPLPPLAEQHRIVAKVDELMALCDRLEADQADAEAAHAQLVQALLGSLTQATDAADFRASWQRLSEHFHTLFTTEASVDALKQTVLQLAVMGKLVPQRPEDGDSGGLLSRLRLARAEWLKLRVDEDAECRTMQRKLSALEPANSPFSIPCTWQPVRLIDCCQVLVDCHNKTAPYASSGIPIIRTSNIRERKFRFDDLRFVSEATYEFWSRRCPPQSGDIMFTREAPMGEAAIVPEGAMYCLGQRTMLIRPMHDFISKEYLLIALTEPHLLERASTEAIGSTVKHLRVGDVENLTIPMPPLAEQRRIVAKVDELMALCDQLKAQLQQARQQHAQLASVLVEQAVAA